MEEKLTLISEKEALNERIRERDIEKDKMSKERKILMKEELDLKKKLDDQIKSNFQNEEVLDDLKKKEAKIEENLKESITTQNILVSNIEKLKIKIDSLKVSK